MANQTEQLLASLINKTGSAMGEVATGIGQNATSILQALLNKSPVTSPAMTANRIVQSMAAEEGEKVLRKQLKDMATDLGQTQGVEKLAQSVLNLSQQTQTGTVAPARSPMTNNVQPIQNNNIPQSNNVQPQQNTNIDISSQLGLLGNLLTLGGKLAGPTTRAKALRNIGMEQEIKGEQPLQAGEREKIEMQNEADLFKNIMTTGNKAVSAETSKLLGNVNSGLEQLDALSQAFEQDPNLFKKTNLTATGQQVDLMLKDLTDILGRLRSGGAINEEEFKSFKKQLPNKGFFAARIEQPSTVKTKINKLKKLFQDIKSKAEPNNQLSTNIQKALQSGYTREEIIDRLKKKGQL